MIISACRADLPLDKMEIGTVQDYFRLRPYFVYIMFLLCEDPLFMQGTVQQSRGDIL